MTKTVKLISGVAFTPGTAQDLREGLVGYITLTFADLLLLDGLVLRKTTAGTYALSYPSRSDSQGRNTPTTDRSTTGRAASSRTRSSGHWAAERDPQEANRG